MGSKTPPAIIELNEDEAALLERLLTLDAVDPGRALGRLNLDDLFGDEGRLLRVINGLVGRLMVNRVRHSRNWEFVHLSPYGVRVAEARREALS